MPRVDRVFELLDYLRGHDAATVAVIAADLGVSRRTVLRDLATLRDRGWPIRAEAGPGGGVLLERDRGLSAVHLSGDEIAALWLSVATVREHQRSTVANGSALSTRQSVRELACSARENVAALGAASARGAARVAAYS